MPAQLSATKGPLDRRAGGMDALGKEFFAGAAFAGDEDGRRIGLGDFGCQMFQQFHLRRSTDDLIEC